MVTISLTDSCAGPGREDRPLSSLAGTSLPTSPNHSPLNISVLKGFVFIVEEKGKNNGLPTVVGQCLSDAGFQIVGKGWRVRLEVEEVGT